MHLKNIEMVEDLNLLHGRSIEETFIQNLHKILNQKPNNLKKIYNTVSMV